MLGIFGIGLIALWIIGLAMGVSQWFLWVDGMAGVVALYAAMVGTELSATVIRATGLVLSLVVLALWIVGLATRESPWLTWISFALAILLLGASVAGPVKTTRAHIPVPA